MLRCGCRLQKPARPNRAGPHEGGASARLGNASCSVEPNKRHRGARHGSGTSPGPRAGLGSASIQQGCGQPLQKGLFGKNGRNAARASPMNYLLALLLSLVGFGEPPRPVAEAEGSGAVSIPLSEARSGPPLPAVTPARGDDPPLVVIDPGHGGRDPGAPSAIG